MSSQQKIDYLIEQQKKLKELKDATLKSTQNNIDKVVENTKIDNSVSNYKSQSKIDEIIKKTRIKLILNLILKIFL